MMWREETPKQAEQIALTNLVSLGLFVLLLACYFASVGTLLWPFSMLLALAFICPLWISCKQYRAMRTWRVQLEWAERPRNPEKTTEDTNE